MVIEYADQVILIDPMLSPVGVMPPLAYFRFKARKNPIAPLPESSESLLSRVTHCLITHKHPDHIDQAAVTFLVKHKISVTCSIHDERRFRKMGINVVQAVDYWKRTSFLGGKIEGIPARHGYGFVAKPMGNVMGFYLEFPGQPSVYLSSDTIYTNEVKKVLIEYKPDISVVASGTAQLDIFKPLLMTVEDIMRFVQDAPGKVIANHMEAVNHCPTTRTHLKEALAKAGLLDKVLIPQDGECMHF